MDLLLHLLRLPLVLTSAVLCQLLDLGSSLALDACLVLLGLASVMEVLQVVAES